MKNSLFMRAVAAAAAVPVALTQCLTVASAVSVTSIAPAIANDALVTASDANNITLTGNDGLLYIEPKEMLKNVYVQDEKDATIFTKDSRWNVLVDGYIKNASKQSGNIDPEFIVNVIQKKVASVAGGKFSEVVDFGLKNVTKENATFEIVNGDIIIKAHVSKPDFTEDVKNFLGGAMKEISEKANDENLAKVKYTADPSGDFKLTLHTGNLSNDTTVAVDFEFVPASTGKAIGFGQLPEFALEIVDSLTKDAENAINASSAMTDAEKADAIAKINGTNGKYGMQSYKNAIIKANKAIDRAKEAEKTVSYDSVKDIIAAVNKEILKRNYRGIKKQIPESASAIMANEQVKNAYNKAVSQFNTKVQNYNIDIAADLLGAEADRIYDITGSTKKGVAEATAKYPDDEKAAVKEFFETSAKYNTEYTFVDSWKEIKVEANFSNIDEVEAGSADVKYYRVVKVAPKNVVTTTTTTTNTATTTTDTNVTSVSTTVSTAGEDIVTSVSTVTETSPVTSETDTTPVTSVTTVTETEPVTIATETAPVTSVTTVTETEPVTSETDTTPVTSVTTVTETEPVTTTSTQEPVVPGTTRTAIVNTPVIKADKTVGFYLDVDEEFHKEQVTKLTYSIDKVRQYIDEDNTVVKWESIESGDAVDITGKFDFGFATPVNTYDSSDLTFAYQVALKATEDITADDGTVIATKGGTFKNPDNSDVSVTAYIGVKGDANLDNKVDSGDATTTLIYYTNISTGQTPSEAQFSSSVLVEGPDAILDHFAAFLCDTTNEPYPQVKDASPDNWKLMKGDRSILSDDATQILMYYTELSINSPKGRETWNVVQGIAE